MFIPGQSTLHELRRGTPGHRFRKHYDVAHRKRNKLSVFGRILRFLAALAALVVGIFLIFIPGPAVVFLALAGALLATESRGLAAALDWTELKLRAAAGWAVAYWKSRGWWGRSVVVVVLSLATIAFFALVYWFYFLR